MDLDSLLTQLRSEYQAGLEDFQDLVRRLPAVGEDTLRKYAEKDDFTVLVLLSATETSSDPSLIPALLSADRARETIETATRLICRWFAREVLDFAASLIGGERQKAGLLVFAEAWPLASAEDSREVAFACLRELGARPDFAGEVIAVCTKAICGSVKSEQLPAVSDAVSRLVAELLRLRGTTEHYCLLTPLLRSHPELEAQYRDRITDAAVRDLIAASSSQRSAAANWLRHCHASDAWWDCFFDVYLSLENYSRHLVESIWTERMSTLVAPGREAWLKVLLARVRAHENASVKKLILKMVMKTEAFAQFPDIILNEVILLIGDSSIFADAPRHAGFSRFATSIPSYYRQFFASLVPASQPAALRAFLSSVNLHVQHQSGFYNAMLTFRDFRPDCSYLDSRSVENLSNMVRLHFTNITPAQRKEIFGVFAEMARHRTEDCDVRLIVDLLALFPVDLLPLSRPIFPLSAVKPWLGSTIESHSKGEKGGIQPSSVPLLLQLTEGGEECYFPQLVLGPLRLLSCLYTNSYLQLPQICACLQYARSVSRLGRLSAERQQTLRTLLRDARSQLLSLLTLQAGNFADESTEWWRLRKEAKATLAATVVSITPSECESLAADLTSALLSSYPTSPLRALGLLSFLYTAYKFSPKTIRPPSALIRFLFGVAERREMDGKLAQEVTVLKWKLVRLGLTEEVIPLIRADLNDLLDVSSIAMKKTAFRLLKKSLKTSYICDVLPVQTAVLTGLRLVQECKLDLSVSILRLYYEFALNFRLFSAPDYIPTLQSVIATALEVSNERWQFRRGITLHLLSAIQREVTLVYAFEPHVAELALGAELRGKDLDLHFSDLYVALGVPMRDSVPKTAVEAGHYSRFVTLAVLERLEKGKWVSDLARIVTAELKKQEARKVDMPNSLQLKRKVAIGQLLLTLAPYFPYGDSLFVLEVVPAWVGILRTPVSSSVRYYLEKLIVCAVCQSYSALSPLLYSNLGDTECKAQFGASMLFVAGGVLMNSADADKPALIRLISAYLVSNTAVLRRTAHFLLLKYAEKVDESSGELQQMLEFMQKNADCRRMRESLEREFLDFESVSAVGLDAVLTGAMNEFGAFLPDPILDRIDAITAELMSETRVEDFSLRVDEFWLLEASAHTLAAASQNYQRKVTQTAALESQHKGHHVRHPAIVLASFVQSPTTLAGLTRSCEVFAVQKLVYSDKRLLETLEYKQMAVTAEKWMPMVFVHKSEVAAYLARRKASGYAVLCVARRRAGVEKVPEKVVLVPAEEDLPEEVQLLVDGHLSLGDLSTHIAASLCVWEYTKQNFLQTND